MAAAELGREPEAVVEVTQTMRLSRRTAFRDQEHFREAFPTETRPGRMNQVTGAQARYEETYRRLKGLGADRREAEHRTFYPGAALADV